MWRATERGGVKTKVLAALLSLPGAIAVHAAGATPAAAPLPPLCVTTDPVVVLGQTILPSEMVCVPPQVGPLSAAAVRAW
jgi:hypothetical protein